MVGIHTLLDGMGVEEVVTCNGTGKVHFFSTNKDDLLARKEFLCNEGCSTTHEVAAAVDNNDL